MSKEGQDLFNRYDYYDTQQHHQQLVKRLAKPGEDIIKSLTPEKAHLLHMVIGVSGEAGELLDAIKKYVIYNKPLDRENVIEEIGDLQFYLQGILNELDIDPNLCKCENIAKLEKRYGETYSDQAAQDRDDKK